MKYFSDALIVMSFIFSILFFFSYEDFISKDEAVLELAKVKFATQELENLGDCTKWKEPNNCLQMMAGIHNSVHQLGKKPEEKK